MGYLRVSRFNMIFLVKTKRNFSSKFGLIRVDFDSPNRTRTWKESAYWLQSILADRTLDV